MVNVISSGWNNETGRYEQTMSDGSTRVGSRDMVQSFARKSAILDREACRLAETEMDGEWAGEHSTALAKHLGCSVRELPEDYIAWAEEAYAAEVQHNAEVVS